MMAISDDGLVGLITFREKKNIYIYSHPGIVTVTAVLLTDRYLYQSAQRIRATKDNYV